MSGTVDSQGNQLIAEIFGSSCDKDSDNTGTSNRVHLKYRSSIEKRTHDASVSNCDSDKMLDKSELSQPEHFSSNEQQTFVKSLPLVNADVNKSLTLSNSRCSVGAGSEKIDGGDRHEEKSNRPGDGHDSSTALLQQREERINMYGDGDNGIEGHSGGSLKDPGRKVEQLLSSKNASRFTDRDTSVDLHREILNDACRESRIVSAMPLNPIPSPGHHLADDSYMSSTRSLVKSPLPSLDLNTEMVCDDMVQRDLSNHEMRSCISETQDYICFLHEKLDTVESDSEKLVPANTVLKKNMSAQLLISQTELQRKTSQIVSPSGVKYGDSKASREADKSEIQKKRKCEEDSPGDSKKHKMSPSVSARGITAKRNVDKYPSSSDPSNRHREKHHTRNDYPGDKTLDSCSRVDKHALDSKTKEEKKVHENDKRRQFEKEKCVNKDDKEKSVRSGEKKKIVRKVEKEKTVRKGETKKSVKKDHIYERDKKTRDTSKTDHSIIRATEKSGRRERNSHSDKTQHKSLKTRSHQSFPSSKGIGTENSDLGNGASHSTPISKAILEDDVEHKNSISHSDKKTCAEPGQDGIKTRDSPIHLTQGLPNLVSMECHDHIIPMSSPALQVVDMESGVANDEQNTCPDSLQVAPNRIAKQAGDLGSTSHAPLISQRSVILGHNPSPNDICRDGDNKSNSSWVLAKSIGLQHVQHVKQVDEKTLNVKGDVKAVKQRNRASNLPLTSLKRKRVTYCDTTTKQSDKVILEGGDHIDEVNHFLISPKKIRMQYTTVYSHSSNNNENKALKELSSAAETDEITDYCEGAKCLGTDETTNHGKGVKCLVDQNTNSASSGICKKSQQVVNGSGNSYVFKLFDRLKPLNELFSSMLSSQNRSTKASKLDVSKVSKTSASNTQIDKTKDSKAKDTTAKIVSDKSDTISGKDNPVSKVLKTSVCNTQTGKTKDSKAKDTTAKIVSDKSDTISGKDNPVSKVSKTSASNTKSGKGNDSKAKDTTAKIVSDKSYTIDGKDNPVSKVSKTSASNTKSGKGKDSKAKDTTAKIVSDKSDTISGKDNPVSKVSKTLVCNTQTGKAKHSKVKDATAKILSDKSDTISDKDSIDSLQLQVKSDKEISDDSSLEDGELRSESPDDYIGSKRIIEKKPNFELRIKLKTSKISASTSGQQRGQRRGTKLSTDLYRPTTGESHSSNQATKAFSTLKGYKIPQKDSLGSQKRSFSDVSSIDKTPKRKRLVKSSSQSVD